MPQSVFITFHWVFGREGGKKERGKGEIKHIFFALLHKSIIYCLWLCEAAKMLFTQPTDSISNPEEMILLWYIAFQYIYIIYSAVFVVENAIF